MLVLASETGSEFAWLELNVVNCRLWFMSLQLVLALPVVAVDTFSSAYISEFMAENQHGIKDEAGEMVPWIELCNGGSTPVNLNGWFLTDSATNLTQWRLPGVVLLPDKYMVVFASGKNRTNDLAHLHTNFRLNKEGGYLALVGASTNIVSEFSPNYAKQKPDVSYGRVRGEPGISGPIVQATPGAPNASSGPGFAPEVVFSRSSGSFTERFSVQLSSATGSVIRYTLDGSFPNSKSTTYGAPLSITNTTYVRARSYEKGLLPGPVRSEAYLRLSTNLVRFNSSLPLLVLDTFGKSAPIGARETFVHLSFHEPMKGKSSLTNRPSLTMRAGFRVRGSTSSGFRGSSTAICRIHGAGSRRCARPRAVWRLAAEWCSVT